MRFIVLSDFVAIGYSSFGWEGISRPRSWWDFTSCYIELSFSCGFGQLDGASSACIWCVCDIELCGIQCLVLVLGRV
jgi:hypothetical protein